MDILSFHVIFAPCVLLYTVIHMHVAAWCCMYSIHVRNELRNELRVVLCEGPDRARTPWKMDKLEGTAERTHRSVWFSMVLSCPSVGLCQGYVTSLFWAVGTFKAGPASGWAKWSTLESLGITRHVLKCFQHISPYQWYSCCVSQWYLVISKSPVLMQNPTSPSCQVRCRWFSSYQRLWKDPGMCHLNCIWIIWHHLAYLAFSCIFGQVSHWKQRNLMRPADSCRFLQIPAELRLQAVMMANICLQTYLVSNLSALLTRADVGIYTMRCLARKLHIRITVWQHEGLQLASISTSSSNVRSSWMFLVVVVIAYIAWTIPEQ